MNIKDIMPWYRDKKDISISSREEHPISFLQREMNTLFDDFFRGFDVPTTSFMREKLASGFNPNINVIEKDKSIEVSMELPGMLDKDIDLAISKESLTIKGAKQDEHEDEREHFYRRECSYGAFQRTIPLPSGIDENNATATFKNGVLNISLPKTEEAQREVKRIQIKTE